LRSPNLNPDLGALKMTDMKTADIKMYRHEIDGHKVNGHENARPVLSG